ncbi:MAG: cyanophycin synthetase [Candidatus Zambryskibacteria bacterium CG10_big_fil_rev_8_21_14_0_10_42_12]|uniref:Cyanophycin synthetase n=1 Tax=Candidatus Zambryskibacteria bacterium CG10_big_fil_rev_8_21_14_0_10_42_12 TaxID=1975115 RepID=A0A2H0QYT6_9BACT|nr:MAG: cyanophycin synthetase [Candidatus Zambryskibacteria bacterium CG10_big_fil_rev_8_21_14_0_10_42_12]
MKKLPSTSQIFIDLAPEFGAEVILDDSYGYAGLIKFPNGIKKYFKYNHLDVNTLGSSEIARDKDYAALFLSKFGYHTIQGDTFYSKEWAEHIGSNKTIDKAYAYAEKIGYPVFVKPNNSGLGFGVALAYSKEELRIALKEALIYDKIVIVQKAYLGMHDFRIVVFKGEIVCAYKKTPLHIAGDGKKTVQELFDQKKQKLKESGRGMSVELEDYRIQFELKRNKLDNNSILETGQDICLLPNANMSQGADGIDVTEDMSQKWKEWAVQVARDMNLVLCGIDVLVKNDIKGEVGEHVILEVNHSPGFQHYATLGDMAQKRVQTLYRDIFTYLAHE